ncbi:universal stress protein A-like protein [Quillaja saponaria]|uniref:Universal stress protein A-like protein n=1 Tax=Quillaja saponaria TaxID=32244 RepID=A0AAD7KNJ9_QUISA|nr:universal stress protein A-like protein [Quillaja saponaria]
MGEALGQEREAKKKVMVAIDENESSHYALMWTLENLKESITKSSLVIFMAQPAPNNNYSLGASLGTARLYCPLSATPDWPNSVHENHRKFTLALLEKANDICASQGVKAETVTDVGDPGTAICDAVQKHNINFLVLGDWGLGKIKRAFLGSVSNYCVHNAKCPVLVVKKPDY